VPESGGNCEPVVRMGGGSWARGLQEAIVKRVAFQEIGNRRYREKQRIGKGKGSASTLQRGIQVRKIKGRGKPQDGRKITYCRGGKKRPQAQRRKLVVNKEQQKPDKEKGGKKKILGTKATNAPSEPIMF